MTVTQLPLLDRPQPCPDRTVLVRTADGLALWPVRRRDEVLARLYRRSLDARLSSGAPAEDGRLLAVRAHQLVRPAYRRHLAKHWTDLAERARRRQLPFDARVPIDRARHQAAAEQIQRIADVLRGDGTVSARGVAIAQSLLTAPRSPVYRFGGDGADLVAAIGRALAEL